MKFNKCNTRCSDVRWFIDGPGISGHGMGDFRILTPAFNPRCNEHIIAVFILLDFQTSVRGFIADRRLETP